MQHFLAYTPYGFSPRSVANLAIGFDGESLDCLVGGYHLGQGRRLYLPSLMRLTSPDDLSPFYSGGLNSYMFCSGDPVNFIDSTGRMRKFFKNQSKNQPKNQGFSGGVNAKINADNFSGTLPDWKPFANQSNGLKSSEINIPGFEEATAIDMPADKALALHPQFAWFIKANSRRMLIGHVRGRAGFYLGNKVLKKHADFYEKIKPYMDMEDEQIDEFFSGKKPEGLTQEEFDKIVNWDKKSENFFGDLSTWVTTMRSSAVRE